MLVETIEDIIARRKAELEALTLTLTLIRTDSSTRPRREPKKINQSTPRDPIAKAIVEVGAVLEEFTVKELHSHLLTTPKISIPKYRTFRQQVTKGFYDRYIRKIREERRGNNTSAGRPSYVFTLR